MSEEKKVDEGQSTPEPNQHEAEIKKETELFYGDKEKEGEASEETPKSEESKDEEPSKEESEDKEDSKEDEAKDKEPEQVKLVKPEDLNVSKEVVAELEEFANNLKLDQDQAQALLEREANSLKFFVEAQAEMLEEQKVKWREESESDKEIGGEQLKESAELAKRALKAFGTKEFTESLESSGFGNHPEVIRIFARIGKEMASDKFLRGSQNMSKEIPLEEVFYGSPDKN